MCKRLYYLVASYGNGLDYTHKNNLCKKMAGAREDPSQTIQLREATMNKLRVDDISRIFTSQPFGNK